MEVLPEEGDMCFLLPFIETCFSSQHEKRLRKEIVQQERLQGFSLSLSSPCVNRSTPQACASAHHPFIMLTHLCDSPGL